MTLCACGCKQAIEWKSFHSYRPAKFIRGHNESKGIDGISNEELGLVYGTLLGDANISARTNWPRVSAKHSINQLAYVEYMARRLPSIKPTVAIYRTSCQTNNNLQCASFQSQAHPELHVVYDTVTNKDGRKTVNKKWLSRVSTEGLAWWFADDGSVSVNTSGNINGVRFATNAFSLSEHKLLCAWLNRLGFEALISSFTDNRTDCEYLYLRMRKYDARRWIKMLEKYAPPSIEYKFYDRKISRASTWRNPATAPEAN